MTTANLIHFFEVEPWEQKTIEKNLDPNLYVLWKEYIKDIDISKIKNCEILSCFVYSKITADLINQLPHLKMIATRSTGVDHIDLKACQKKGIHVANVPLYGERTVAEHTFALILALTRKIIPSVERTRSGSFSLEGLRGQDLSEKTMGIIGAGNIGCHVAHIAHGFEMKVLAYDIKPNLEAAKKWSIQYVTLEELLQRSDIISLHVPYLESTHHLINSSQLTIIKKGAILINTSRGSVVETQALIRGLSEGIFGGLGLDVLESEPIIREERELLSALYQGDQQAITTLLENEFLLHHHHPNVIITPHNAFNTHEALERILMTTLQNIEAFKKAKILNSAYKN